ncbi:MAG: DUF72 domain-containing protein [Sedimentisphaerales bacterium]|nr:DUF72 domain-containing protein [Sedimentisphaerales bacterium]
MAKGKCQIRVGTSGWHYAHWQGRFYPADLAKDRWLEYYSRHFDTVEINNTFYHLPKAKTMTNWHDNAPTGFVYAVKVSRYITHVKKLRDPAESIQRFFELADLLKRRLGPILYQLPPSQHKDLDKLDAFIKILPKRHHAVFEFRHESWHEQDTFELMNERGVALCVHDLGESAPPRVVTGEMAYVRFHGTSGGYAGNYTDTMLAQWADWIREQAGNVGAVYAYFNNDVEGHAIDNARTLKGMLGL